MAAPPPPRRGVLQMAPSKLKGPNVCYIGSVFYVGIVVMVFVGRYLMLGYLDLDGNLSILTGSEREGLHGEAGLSADYPRGSRYLTTQTPGRIQKVDPPVLGSSTPMV